MKNIGHIIKIPDSDPGLLLLQGKQRPFVVEETWRSPVAPELDQAVEVELNAAGEIVTLRVIAVEPEKARTPRSNPGRKPANGGEATGNKVFLSYRRQDSSGYAGRLSEHLTRHLGKGAVFRDVETIEFGTDFVEAIEKAVGSCSAFILVIGSRWLSAVDGDGRRRLEDPQDFVRLEIVTALSAGVRVIPALVEGARMPKAEELPDDIKAIVRRHAIELTDGQFEHDVERLIRDVRTAMADSRGQSPADPPIEPQPPVAEPKKPTPIRGGQTKPIPIRIMRSYLSVLLCLPLGIAAVGASNKCAAALSSSDPETAIVASNAARKWNGLAIPCSFLWWIGLLVLVCRS
jgi:hypothetical protein